MDHDVRYNLMILLRRSFNIKLDDVHSVLYAIETGFERKGTKTYIIKESKLFSSVPTETFCRNMAKVINHDTEPVITKEETNTHQTVFPPQVSYTWWTDNLRFVLRIEHSDVVDAQYITLTIFNSEEYDSGNKTDIESRIAFDVLKSLHQRLLVLEKTKALH